MEVSGVSLTSPNAASSAPAGDPVAAAVSVQKKALEIQEQSANALIESIPDPDSSVGQNVDVRA